MISSVIDARGRRLSLRARILLICGSLVAVCLVATAIGWFGQQKLMDSFASFERTEELTLAQLEIDRSVQKLRVAAERFLSTGASSQFDEASTSAETLLVRLKQMHEQSPDGEFRDLANELETHLRTFADQLKLAAAERNLRTELVEEVLPEAASRVFKQLENIRGIYINADLTKQEGGLSSKLIRVERIFSDGRSGLYQYLARPQYSSYSMMLDRLTEATSLIDEVKSTVEPATAFEQDLDQLAASLISFREFAQRTFQATRGYMYYSNVVMAGEISEFSYYSDQLKSLVKLRQQENTLARERTLAAIRNRTLIASAFAIVLATLVGIHLSYMIVPPLTALTESFRKLSEGKTVSDVPGTHREDEIGRMARAAAVFSERNRETQELLDRTTALANELDEKATELQETNAELDSFAYVASHDLKSPLRGIDNLASWIEEDCGELLPEESKKHLGLMRERVGRMNSLLDDLLAYSRVGRTGQSVEDVDLAEMLRSLTAVVDNPDGLTIKVPANLPTLQTARAPLQQVMLNLITNAVKYNDKQSAGVIDISLAEEPDFVRFRVSDNGIGIEPAHHERIFQMYQRVAPDKAEGSGMGLAIVRKQIESFGGEISVESRVGVGTTFDFTWPKRVVATTI